MPTDPPAAQATREPFEISAGSYQAGDLHVLSFEGTEEVNGLYAFDVRVWGKDTDDGQIEAAVLGMPAALAMQLPDGATRYVRGIVAGIVLEGRGDGGRHVFRFQLVPQMWLLQKRVTSRIFQDKTVQEIAGAVLDEHGIAATWNLLATYPSRQYCVQYQESDHAFVTRILAEEGIFFWFDQPAGGGAGATPPTEQLMLADDAHAYAPIDGDPGLLYRRQVAAGAMHMEENHVLDFRARTRVEPAAVMLRDYDFRRPLLDLTGSAPAATPAGTAQGGIAAAVDPSAPAPLLEVYDHHGEYEEPDADPAHAAVYLEQLRAGVREAEATSLCRRILPGHQINLSDHDIDKLNAAWVVARVEHRGVAPELARGGTHVYENTFRCAPAEVPLRPARPARVLRQTTESAVVVGPVGEEIFTDAYGRVKVQFHWDRDGTDDDRSSCWMRVAQPWAGPGWGSSSSRGSGWRSW